MLFNYVVCMLASERLALPRLSDLVDGIASKAISPTFQAPPAGFKIASSAILITQSTRAPDELGPLPPVLKNICGASAVPMFFLLWILLLLIWRFFTKRRAGLPPAQAARVASSQERIRVTKSLSGRKDGTAMAVQSRKDVSVQSGLDISSTHRPGSESELAEPSVLLERCAHLCPPTWRPRWLQNPPSKRVVSSAVGELSGLGEVNTDCPICLKHQRDTLLVPCGHLLCRVCGQTMIACPKCHSPIEGLIRALF